MSLEQELADLKSLHKQETNQSEVEMLQELIWEMTDLDEIELPIQWYLYDEDEQIKFLKQLIIENIDQDLLDAHIEYEGKERVRKRLAGETKGFGDMM